MLKSGTQNDDRFTDIKAGGDSVAAGNGQDYVVYDATGWLGKGGISQTLDGGNGTDTLLIRLYKPQYDAMKAELMAYAASLPKELNLTDRNFVSASNPLGINYSQFNKLLDGTLTTGQNSQSNFFTFQSIGVSIKQFEAMRFEIINSPPKAADDRVTAVEDTTTLIKVADLLRNDADVDGNSLTLTSVQGAEHGVASLVTVAGVQYISFVPAKDYNGEAKFTYTVSDGKGGTSTVAVKLDVAPVNDAPVTGGGTAALGDEDTLITGYVPGATDVDLDVLTYRTVGPVVDAKGHPVGGTLDFHADGSFSYAPPANYHGIVRFTYVASDGKLDSAPATVQITVNPVNDGPVSGGHGEVSGDEDMLITGTLPMATDVDGDTLTYRLADGQTPIAGLTLEADGRFSFTPPANFHGDVSFAYSVSDGVATTAPATMTLHVLPVNDAPTTPAMNAFTVAEDANAVVIPIGAADLDGDALSYALVPDAGPAKGNVAFADGVFLYTPTPNANGSDSFSILISDGRGGTVQQAVTVEITPVNDAPVAPAITSVSTDEDTALVGVAIGASDVDGDTLSYAIKNGFGPVKGNVAFDQEHGTYTYTPGANLNGNDHFTVLISDGHGGTAEQVVNVGIAPVNDEPILITTRPFKTVFEMPGSTHQNTLYGSAATIVFDDADGKGTHTITATPMQNGYLSHVVGTAISLDVPMEAGFLVGVTQADLDYLSQDEVVKESYKAELKDPAGGVISQVFTLTLVGANDAPENLHDTNTLVNTVAEGAAKGMLVGITALATDVDHLDTLHYFFKDAGGVQSAVTTDGRFAIDGQTGVVMVNDGSKLDYETARSHDLTVWAADNHGAETSTSFSVGVTDLAEGFFGHTLAYLYRFPVIYQGMGQDFVVTVGDEVEIRETVLDGVYKPNGNGYWPDAMSVDFSDTKVRIDLNHGGFSNIAPINGFILIDQDGQIPAMTGVRLAATNTTFDINSVSVTVDQMIVNLGGLALTPDSYIELDVLFA